jgi:hypothetical protein
MISNGFYFCWQDGNQYVVLEVIQLNDAGGRAKMSTRKGKGELYVNVWHRTLQSSKYPLQLFISTGD